MRETIFCSHLDRMTDSVAEVQYIPDALFIPFIPFHNIHFQLITLAHYAIQNIFIKRD